MNWLLILVMAIFLFGLLSGLVRGGIRLVVSFAATVVTIILVFFLTPYVSKAIYALTPIEEAVESKITDTMSTFVTTSSLDEMGVNEDTIKDMLKKYGISETALKQAGITIKDILSGNVSAEILESNGIPSDILGKISSGGKSLKDVEIPRQVQMDAIENAEIPKVFKDLLKEHNNSEVYQNLGVKSFPSYVAKYLTQLIINIISFIATFIIITIILRAVIFALDIVTSLPVLGMINRLAGAVLGIVIALLFVDFIFLGLTMLFQTEFGKNTMALIQGNAFLSFLYDHNLIMNIATLFR